ncbi:LCP family protein [Candidatus Saccharibacteria bacterium]|nr:LCP family protein [Candidatus Saccharibacteria bacterium]
MDNFRKSKSPKSGRRGAMDGIIGNDSPTRSRRTISSSSNRASKAKEPVGRIGSFGSSDGFRPNKQSNISSNPKTSTSRNPSRRDDGSIDLEMPEMTSRSRRGHNDKKNRHIARRSASVLLTLLILISGFAFGKVYLKALQIFQGGGGAAALNENVDPSLLKGEGDGRINILMLGKGGDGHTAPDLTDTILVASINPIQDEAAIVSIPRDLYVKTPDNGSMKINAVYATAKSEHLSNTSYNDPNRERDAEKAGLKAIEESVQEVLGIPIHYNAMVDFAGFKQAIDTVGGVELNAPKEVYEVMWLEGQNYALNVQPGWQNFDGFRALAYARSRYTSPRGDFDRSERQRLILVALKEKILTVGTLANPIKVNQLISDFGDHVQTNMTVDEMLRLYEIGKDIPSDKIESVGLADPPNDYVHTDNIGGLSVVVPKEGLYQYDEIHGFIRNKLKDGFLADENASILILNGTDYPGLASKTVKELKSFGYNLLPAADAPTKGYTETVIVDLRNGENKYTKRYLEQRFGTNTVPNLPDSTINAETADFVIIIGQNEVSRLEN